MANRERGEHHGREDSMYSPRDREETGRLQRMKGEGLKAEP
jgi:hypothetical protein